MFEIETFEERIENLIRTQVPGRIWLFSILYFYPLIYSNSQRRQDYKIFRLFINPPIHKKVVGSATYSSIKLYKYNRYVRT